MRFYAPAYFRDGCLRRHPVLLPACRLSPLPVSSLRGSKDHAPRERRQPARALSLRVSRGEERRGEGGGGEALLPSGPRKDIRPPPALPPRGAIGTVSAPGTGGAAQTVNGPTRWGARGEGRAVGCGRRQKTAPPPPLPSFPPTPRAAAITRRPPTYLPAAAVPSPT